MTQQTDRLAALKKLEDDFNAFVNSGALVDYYHSFIPEYIELKKAALSQPAAHPEPDNAKLEEAIYRVKADLDFRNVLYPHIMVLLEHALAKPAVNEIEGIDNAVLEAALKKLVNGQTIYSDQRIMVSRVVSAYLKLSGQKEGE